MDSTPQPKAGDRLSVTVTKEDGETILQEETSYQCRLLGSLSLDEGERRRVDVEVTKAIYSRSGSLRTLFVSPCDGSASSRSDGSAGTAERSPRSPRTESAASGESASESATGGPTASESGSGSTSESESGSAGQSRPRTGRADAENGSERSLSRIADELIGDEEFEETEDEDSMVAAAKRRARDQQRDPAIDPSLHES